MWYLWGECTTRDSAGYSHQLRCGTSAENVSLGTVKDTHISWDVVHLGRITIRDSEGYSHQLRCGTSGENVPLGTAHAIHTSWDVVPLGRMYHYGQCRLFTPAEMWYLWGECIIRDSEGYSHQLRCGTSGENVPLGTVKAIHTSWDVVPLRRMYH